MNGSNSDKVPIINIPSSKRIDKLSDFFHDEFKCKPIFFVRVPGRVNLIGEHIDYCGYPVLPMALEQDILVAGNYVKENKLYIRNSDIKYNSVDIELTTHQEIHINPDLNGKPFWYNYVLCGIKGALEYLNNETNTGLQLCIDGNIPPASGLSSSSALVSAACLAYLYAQKAVLSKTEIASLCAKSERYIGTQGGGMDQAIAFLAEKNCAQYITWQPLKATAVALPENAAFVVAHCLAEANKAATNDFNRRVIECRLGAKILELLLGYSSNHQILSLSQLQINLNKTLEEMVELVKVHLHKEIYKKDDICQILGLSEDNLDTLYLTPNTRHLNEFKLRQRALHVYEEAIRVESFRKICSKPAINGKSSTDKSNGYHENDNVIIENLGKLMSGSHSSLKDFYECSHENLDCLVKLSNQMKVHSRLTGAGWGGCIVALCPKEKVLEYIEMLKEEYYVKICNIDKSMADAYVFATDPNCGALIYYN